jgi:hypothetical protein
MKPLSVKGYYKKELYLTDVSLIYEKEELETMDGTLVNGFDGGNLKFQAQVREKSFEGW